jgi:DNA-binding MarR family transcriptional regulator
MNWCPGGDELDQDIYDAMTTFFSAMLQRGEKLAEQYDVPMFCVKAMHRFRTSVPMKELSKRMQCDPSFVTMIADALEERGLAKREPNPADRRIKNLVLTDRGVEVKAAIEKTMHGQMPWAQSLDVAERETLLALIRKMNAGAGLAAPTPAGAPTTT